MSTYADGVLHVTHEEFMSIPHVDRFRNREIVKGVALGQEPGPQVRYAVARLYAVTGYSAEALAALAGCLESVPPSRQANLKEHAKRCPDFAKLASTEAFAKALDTPSKIPESACSGGSGCANCPMRGNCAKANNPHDR